MRGRAAGSGSGGHSLDAPGATQLPLCAETASNRLAGFFSFFLELELPKVCVGTRACDQFGVCPTLDDTTLFHDDNLVGVHDGG
jgi:hypothetical protein